MGDLAVRTQPKPAVGGAGPVDQPQTDISSSAPTDAEIEQRLVGLQDSSGKALFTPEQIKATMADPQEKLKASNALLMERVAAARQQNDQLKAQNPGGEPVIDRSKVPQDLKAQMRQHYIDNGLVGPKKEDLDRLDNELDHMLSNPKGAAEARKMLADQSFQERAKDQQRISQLLQILHESQKAVIANWRV